MMGSMGRRVCALGIFALVAFAQEPKAPLPYTTEDITYRNPEASEVELAGTFTKPKTSVAVAAVLLISGAGPQDRDESIAGHKPFLTLADYLTRRNVAVLRVDDRGVGQSTGNYKNATTADFASDAAAGIAYLASRKDVDRARIGLIGHGEGAIQAAMIAAASPQLISFVVLLNGTAYSGEKVLLEQTSRAELASGFPDEEIDADFRIGRGVYSMLEAGRSVDEIEGALDRVPEEYKPFVAPWKRRLPQLQSRWLRFFLNYDPASALEKMRCPVLALFGEKDMTIDPEQNAAAMKAAFSRGHNHEAKVKILPNLNYLMQKSNTGLSSEYEKIPETMSPAALEAIGSFVAKQTGQ